MKKVSQFTVFIFLTSFFSFILFAQAKNYLQNNN